MCCGQARTLRFFGKEDGRYPVMHIYASPTPAPVNGSRLARLPWRGFWSFLPHSGSQLVGHSHCRAMRFRQDSQKVFQVGLVAPRGQNGPTGREKRSQGQSGGTSRVALEWCCGLMEKPRLVPGRSHLVPALSVAEGVH